MLTEIKTNLAAQRRFFATGQTLPYEFRIQALLKLKAALKSRESEFNEALRQDLRKSEFESYGAELGFIFEEINHTVRYLKKWMKPRRVPTPMMHWPSQSQVYSEPKGVVLVLGPWNYPMQLIFAPVVGAIAAGNCVIIKPSEIARHSEEFICKLVSETFPKEFMVALPGGLEETKEILLEKFDHIFFTGSTVVGRLVMLAAANNLTPITLELGGKSPCIVDEIKELDIAAKRIVWGTYFNAGQTCVSPDYLLVKRSMKDRLIAAMKKALIDFYGPDPKASPDFGRIIDDRHFDRLSGLLKGANVLVGGETDKRLRYIAPTIIDGVSLDSPCMADEIFGPILPVFEYDTLEGALDFIANRPTPLSCYIFSDDQSLIDQVIKRVPFGGGCINNTLIHLAVPELPFGGVGTSGIGAYHGHKSFEVFSHFKSIVKTPWYLDLWLKYPPYSGRVKFLKLFMK